MTRSFGVPLAAGLVSSLLFLSLAKGFAAGMLLSYLAPLPLMMVGLYRGNGAVLLASLAATAAVALTAGGFAPLPFAVVVLLPSLVVVRQASLWRTSASNDVEWYPPGLVLSWLTGIGLALMVIGAILVPDRPDGVENGSLQAWVADTIGRTLEMMAPDLTNEQRKAAAAWWVPFFPAMVAGSWLAMAVVNAVTAQASWCVSAGTGGPLRHIGSSSFRCGWGWCWRPRRRPGPWPRVTLAIWPAARWW
ncbi:hypothetical protein [Paramagnetospirillum magneticum]|uniref:DUF2232 domain-containing protein n=1 Tax=Paramagnetospirillum magneticum (strain ATCC 700264 / AMB-1) TaxID=342108 RepID=Q2W5H1_PARM1|nr:hypothetical protein [Paramagnetospirillum magneticum]BAE50904.1 hypothetical protein amb2100 [Paramagnetospirillum magneticum AMB-1]